MNLVDILTAVVLILVSYMVFAEFRYTLRRRASENWPTTGATVDSGMIAFRGLPSIWYRVDFTYSYRVDGLQRTGRFGLLVGNKKSGEELRQELVGKNILIKYKPGRPEVTLLIDRELGGRRILQGPSWTYR
jgi:hypothetical protein